MCPVIIGIPKEIKNNEFRVSATASSVHAYVSAGHQVLVEKNAGLGSGISNEDYIKAGAQIIDSADEVWQKADLIQKVKEPIEAEYSRMRKGQILYTYLHLAANKACTQAVIDSGITAIAYETGEAELAHAALDKAFADDLTYPLAILLRRVFFANWPAQSFAAMRAQLHPKICTSLFGGSI